MITSMTGFGRGEASSDGLTVTVELKTVNSRYLDISLRLPQLIKEHELQFKELIQNHLERGKVNVNIRIDTADTGQPDVTFNKKLARGYKEMLNELRDATHIEQSVTLQDLMQFNDLFEARKEDEETRQQIWLLTKKATTEATQALVEMRCKEGGQLRDDLLGRIEHMGEMLAIVQTKTNGRSEKTKKELLERIHNLIESDKIDDDRLEMEVAMLADKMDITEEIVRTQSHLKYFKEAVNNEEAVGRRLNFLSQEINREINTIGSKANDSEISQYVVQAKESLEQIKEQIQNVE
ncbi:MAG TPA: YicC/YloC family endoribonuclease [Fodinibius sp.]|nr:YicC/YloC family endoribonuclease [Fodinibius sp.]